MPPFVLALVSLLALSSPPEEGQPQRLTPPDVSPVVAGVLEMPQGSGPHPAVILLPGSSGWRLYYAAVAKQYASSGFIALALDYYAETGPPGDREATRRLWPQWEATVRAAAAYLRSSKNIAPGRLGLVGFSQGASLAVSASPSMPELGAVVAFFGGAPDTDFKHVPPLLILHGDADTVVPVRNAYRLRDAMTAAGREVELHVYPGAEHAFNAIWAPAYCEETAADARRRAEDFLRRKLEPH